MAEIDLEQQFEEGRQERLAKFKPPRPREQLREAEVGALAEALEEVMLEASDGQIQPSGDVGLSIGEGMADGSVTPELYGALEMLAGFLELAGQEHPELDQYSFDHKQAVSTREGVLQTAASLKQLANDRRAMGRMKAFAPATMTDSKPADKQPEEKDSLDVSALFMGGKDGE